MTLTFNEWNGVRACERARVSVRAGVCVRPCDFVRARARAHVRAFVCL